jgi:chemotaxis protein methyltransferase CheR
MITDITDEEINSLTQAILVRYGIDFTCYEPKSLKRRIIKLLNTFDFESTYNLWGRLLTDQSFIKTMMNEISVGMTSMFRDPVFWIHMRQLLHQDFNAKPEISIWHAGCSTGEEVHSMGIVLHETNLAEKAKALATDFNSEALSIAQKGVYHKIKMIENERNYAEYNHFHSLSAYTTPVDGKHLQVRPDFTRHVEYRYHNLVSDPFRETFDIILCRNVMIYFDTPTKEKLVNNFYRSLNPGGYLVIGFYDVSLPVTDRKLFSVIDEDAKIFQKLADPVAAQVH